MFTTGATNANGDVTALYLVKTGQPAAQENPDILGHGQNGGILFQPITHGAVLSGHFTQFRFPMWIGQVAGVKDEIHILWHAGHAVIARPPR